MDHNAHAAAVAALQLASNRLMDAESRNMSKSTLDKRYRELFKAEDTLKALDNTRGAAWGA
jgi:hypothetical protein